VIVLDTTVLIYAVGADQPLREPCRELIARTPRVALVTTSICWRRCCCLARTTSSRVCGCTRAAITWARDCVLAAAAGRVNAAAIVSADRAFSEADVAHVIPDARGVAALLSR
jgi:uncharacterized protein